MAKKLNVLILCTGQPSRRMIRALEAKGHTYEVYNPQDLYLTISDGESGFDRIYHADPNFEEPVRLKAKNYDVVISRLGDGLSHSTTILRHLTENLGIYCPQDADGLETASNKLKTTQRLAMNGLPVPLTAYAANPRHPEFLIKKVGGLPAIGKLLKGSQGRGVFILETPIAANTSLESFSKLAANFKLQQFIDAGGKDIRAIVAGDQVAVAMERQGKKDFRANVSLGGSGKIITLSKEDQTICVKASKALGLEFSGVDIMKDKKGNTYVIEVNGNPGTKIIDITGHNYFADLIALVEAKVSSGKVNVNRSPEDKDTGSSILNTVFKAVNGFLTPHKEEDEEYITKTDREAREAWRKSQEDENS